MHGRIIANQTFFINKIYELKRDIQPLKEKVSYGYHSNSDVKQKQGRSKFKITSIFIKQEKSLSNKGNIITSQYQIKRPKESILVEFPYFVQCQLVATRFLSKFHQFTNQKHEDIRKKYKPAKYLR